MTEDKYKNEMIHLMVVIDPSESAGFKIVDRLSGRELGGIYKCLYESNINDAARLHLSLYPVKNDGRKYIGEGESLDFEVSRKPEETIAKKHD